MVDGGGGGGWHCGEKYEIRMKCGVTDMATIVCGSQLQSLCTCHTDFGMGYVCHPCYQVFQNN